MNVTSCRKHAGKLADDKRMQRHVSKLSYKFYRRAAITRIARMLSPLVVMFTGICYYNAHLEIFFTLYLSRFHIFFFLFFHTCTYIYTLLLFFLSISLSIFVFLEGRIKLQSRNAAAPFHIRAYE